MPGTDVRSKRRMSHRAGGNLPSALKTLAVVGDVAAARKARERATISGGIKARYRASPPTKTRLFAIRMAVALGAPAFMTARPRRDTCGRRFRRPRRRGRDRVGAEL